jgi:hypothetical protein
MGGGSHRDGREDPGGDRQWSHERERPLLDDVRRRARLQGSGRSLPRLQGGRRLFAPSFQQARKRLGHACHVGRPIGRPFGQHVRDQAIERGGKLGV